MNHPAPFSDAVLDVIAGLVRPHWCALDPFAGIGRVHELPCWTVGVEIEPEWARQHPYTVVGNALALPFPPKSFDAIITSPCYGNRMADHHSAKDASKRITYRHTLGRPLHSDNTGQMQWGEMYRELHLEAWQEATRVLTPGGRFILNVSNHIRGGREMKVVEWHAGTLIGLGYSAFGFQRVTTPRMRQGQNHELRVDNEVVAVFKK